MLSAGRRLCATAARNQRSFASDSEKITATLFTGDGIGPEICHAVQQVISPLQSGTLDSWNHALATSVLFKT